MFRRVPALVLLALLALPALAPAQAQSEEVELRMVHQPDATVAIPGDHRTYGFEARNLRAENMTILLDANETTGTLSLTFDGPSFVTVPAGGAARVNLTVYVPAEARPATYDLRLAARPMLASGGEGATVTWTLPVEPEPLWRLRLDPPTSFLAPGESIDVKVTVDNDEPTSVLLDLRAREREGRLDLSLQDPRLEVRAGASAQTVLRVHRPAEEREGSWSWYDIELTATRVDAGFVSRTARTSLMPSESGPRMEPTPAPPMWGSGGDGAFEVAGPAAEAVARDGFVTLAFRFRNTGSGYLMIAHALRESDGKFRTPFAQGSFPLPPGDVLREFVVDVRDAAPGTYRLVVDFWPEGNRTAIQTVVLPLRVEAPATRPPAPAPPDASRLDVRSAGDLQIAPGGVARGALLVTYLGPAAVSPTESTVLLAPHEIDARVAALRPSGSLRGFEVHVASETLRLRQGVEQRVEFVLRAPDDARVGAEGAVAIEVLPRGPHAPERETVRVRVVEAAPPPAGPLAAMGSFVQAYPLASGSIAVAGAALATVPLWRREWWRYLAALPLLPLYTRLQKREVLDHKTRERIHQLIVQQPGIHYSALKEATGLNAGALVHHLRTLERHGLATSRREGALRCFYPVGARLPPPPVVTFTPMQQRILALLDERPRTQRELAQELGLTQQGVSYHLKTLERKGHLMLERDGTEWRYFRVHEMDVTA